jgi:hypothetical protein
MPSIRVFSGGHTFAAPGDGALDDDSGGHTMTFPHEITFSEGDRITGLVLTKDGDDVRLEVQTENDI